MSSWRGGEAGEVGCGCEEGAWGDPDGCAGDPIRSNSIQFCGEVEGGSGGESDLGIDVEGGGGGEFDRGGDVGGGAGGEFDGG